MSPPNATRARNNPSPARSGLATVKSISRQPEPCKPEVPTDPLTLTIRAAVRAELEALRDELVEVCATRALPRYIDRSELCQMLGVSSPTIRQLEAAGLPMVHVTADVRRYDPDAVRQWLAGRGTP